eukprot:673849-Amphidinium_carterae.1
MPLHHLRSTHQRLGQELWRLKQALYGLKQAPYARQQHLTHVLHWRSVRVYDFLSQLKKKFDLKHTSFLNLGRGFMDSIHMKEAVYEKSVTHRDQHDGEFLQVTLCHLSATERANTHRTSVSRLLWLPAICPDTQYSVKKFSRKWIAPSINDEKVVQHLIRYLRRTQKHAMRFAPSCESKNKSDIEIHAYSDSDWAGCAVTKKSTTGVLFQIHGCSIIHYSKTQSTVAKSSAEADVYALTSASNELIHVQSVVMELGLASSSSNVKLHVHIDSASGKTLIQKLGISKKIKTHSIQ